MAYGIKYQISYKRLSGGITTIDILQNGYTTPVIPLKGAGEPLEIMFEGDINNIYKGTTGSGANINIVTSPFSMVNVFTTDPQEYLVNIYNGYSGTTLVWQGFLNSGIYTEQLNSNKNSVISLKANDGMAILDMIQYRPTVDTYYLGTARVNTIINNCLNKLALTWTDRRGLVNLFTSMTGWIFNDLLIKQENFIDESNIPMSCRDVLTYIMESFGLKMYFIGPIIYIIDPINMHNTAIGQQYNDQWTGSGFTTWPGGFLDISLNEINWFKTGTSLDVLTPINKLDIKYNPYNFSSTTFSFSNIDNWFNSGSWSGTLGNSPNQYKINKTIVYKNVVIDGSILQESIKKIDESGQEYYLKLLAGSVNRNLYGSKGKAAFTFPFTSVYKDASVYIKVSADYYVNTRLFDNIYDGTVASTTVNYIDNSVGLKIGGGGDSSIYWQEIKVTSKSGLNGLTMNQSQIQDAWYTGSTLFGLYHNNYIWDGSISVYIDAFYDTGWYTSNDKNCLVKNVKIEPADCAGNIIENNSINYSIINTISNYIIAPMEITTLLGTGPYGISKAAYIDSGTNKLSDGLYRDYDVNTQRYKCSYLLGQNFVSQYGKPRLILTGDLKVKNYLSKIQNYLIRWSNNLPGKSFYILKGTYNDYREYFSATMIECASTRDNITMV